MCHAEITEFCNYSRLAIKPVDSWHFTRTLIGLILHSIKRNYPELDIEEIHDFLALFEGKVGVGGLR